MTTFRKILSLVRETRRLRAEARKMARGQGRTDRMNLADDLMTKALVIAGRVK